jgi:hypothetical protein
MLGELLGENTGKRIVRRVLGTNPLTAEVSFEETGTMLGWESPLADLGPTLQLCDRTGASTEKVMVGSSHRMAKGSPGKARAWENSDPAAPSVIVGFSIFRPHHRSWRG